MKRVLVAFALSLVLACAAHAGQDFHDAGCGLHSDYSLAVKPDRLVFSRRDGQAAEVVISRGTLRIDGREVALAAADRERMLAIEQGVREALPDVRAIVHDAISIMHEAVIEVSVAFAQDGDAARRSAHRLARSARELHRQVDAADGFANWNDADIDRMVEGAVETLVGEVVGNVVGQALEVAFSGDTGAIAALEARADGLDRSVEAIVEERSRDLEARARGLCPRLQHLAQLGADLQVRLDDGSRLQLVRFDD